MHSKNLERTSLPKETKVKEVFSLDLYSPSTTEVILHRLRMRKAIPFDHEYINILPNYRSQKVTSGIGMPSLSPMVMGPIKLLIDGKQVVANTLEALWQGSKRFVNESEEEFKIARLKFFNSASGSNHRHRSKEKVMYFEWKGQKLDYIQAREVYCRYYVQLTNGNKDLQYLRELMSKGYKLRICGYDGHPITDYRAAYLNPNEPFGHERVLWCLLHNVAPWEECVVKSIY